MRCKKWWFFWSYNIFMRFLFINRFSPSSYLSFDLAIRWFRLRNIRCFTATREIYRPSHDLSRPRARSDVQQQACRESDGLQRHREIRGSTADEPRDPLVYSRVAGSELPSPTYRISLTPPVDVRSGPTNRSSNRSRFTLLGQESHVLIILVAGVFNFG